MEENIDKFISKLCNAILKRETVVLKLYLENKLENRSPILRKKYLNKTWTSFCYPNPFSRSMVFSYVSCLSYTGYMYEPARLCHLRNSKHDWFLSGWSVQVTNGVSTVTTKFAGLSWTCLEMVLYLVGTRFS